MPECVEKLEIWQDAMELVKTVYALTKTWPKEEPYGFAPWNNVGSVLFHGVNPVLEEGCR